MAWLWRLPLDLPPSLASEARWFFLLSGFLIAALFPVSVPSGLLAGLGRFPARNAIALVSLLLRHALLVAAVLCGGTLISVGAVLLTGCMVDLLAMHWASHRYFRPLAYSRRFVDRRTLRSICGYGGHMFVRDIACLIVTQSAPLIVGFALLTPETITYYAIGASLPGYVVSILGTVVFVITPAISKWQAQGNHPAIRTTFIDATKYTLYFTVLLECGLLVLGHPFLSIWMGRRYADGCFAIFAILSAPLFLSGVGLMAARILQGIGAVRPLAVNSIIQAVLTLFLSVGLVFVMGINGVALGASLAVLLTSPMIVVFSCRYTGVSLIELCRKTFFGPALVSGTAVLFWVLARSCIRFDNWAGFVAVGALGAVPALVVVLLIERGLRRLAFAGGQRLYGFLSFALRAPANWLGASRW